MSQTVLPVDIWEHILRQYDSTCFLKLQLVSKFFYRAYWQNCAVIIFHKKAPIEFLVDALSRLKGSKVRSITFHRSNLIDKIRTFNKAQSQLIEIITQNFHYIEKLDGIDHIPETAYTLVTKCPYLRIFTITPGHFTHRVMEEVIKLQYLESFEFYRTRSQLAILTQINSKLRPDVVHHFLTHPPPNLIHLDLTTCATDAILKTIVTHLPHLESLVLDSSPDVTEQVIPLVLKGLPKLKKLRLEKTRVCITEEIFELVMEHPLLDVCDTWVSFMSTTIDIDDKDLESRILAHLNQKLRDYVGCRL